MGHSSGLWSASTVRDGSRFSLKLAGSGIVKCDTMVWMLPQMLLFIFPSRSAEKGVMVTYFMAWNTLNLELLNDLAIVTQEVWSSILSCMESKILWSLLSNILSVWQPSFFCFCCTHISVPVVSMDLSKQEIRATMCKGRIVLAAYSSGNSYVLFNCWDYVETVEQGCGCFDFSRGCGCFDSSRSPSHTWLSNFFSDDIFISSSLFLW